MGESQGDGLVTLQLRRPIYKIASGTSTRPLYVSTFFHGILARRVANPIIQFE